MKKPPHSSAHIIAALLRLEDGYSTALICWEMEVTVDIIAAWKDTYVEAVREAIADRETEMLMARLRKMQADSARYRKLQLHRCTKLHKQRSEPDHDG